MKQEKIKIGQLDVQVVPAKGAAKGAAILCHGFGAPGDDLVSLAQAIREKNSAFEDISFYFPAAPIALEIYPEFESRAWWMIDVEKIQQLADSGKFRELKNSHPEELDGCREMIEEVIEHVAQTLELEHAKIVVGGFSQGAMLTTEVALNHKVPLGGLVIWSGTLICESKWRAIAGDRKFPVYQSHGTLDPVLPFDNATALCTLLADAGLDVEFTEFEGPHTIPTNAIAGTAKLLKKMMV